MSKIDRQTAIENTPFYYNRQLINQIKAFLDSCRKYDELLIYGAAENQELLAKYLKICGLKVKGFLLSSPDDNPLQYDEYPKIVFDTSMKIGTSVGVILGLSDRYYNEIWDNLVQVGVKNIIFIPEYLKIRISSKLRVHKPKNVGVSIPIVDHCNNNCYGCNHYSQLAKPAFLRLDEFEHDVKRLSKLTSGEISYVRIYGGEPLLHEKDYMDIHKAKSWDEIAEFLSNPVPFCRYCDLKNQSSRPWSRSQRTINEYIIDDKAE